MKVNDYLVARGLKRKLIEISSGKGLKIWEKEIEKLRKKVIYCYYNLIWKKCHVMKDVWRSLSFVATCKNEVSNKKEKISSSQCKRKELISFTF